MGIVLNKEEHFVSNQKQNRKWRIEKRKNLHGILKSNCQKTILSFCCIALLLIIQSCSQVNQLDRSIPFNYPFEGEVAAKYGNRIHPVFNTKYFHTGIDIQASMDSDLFATADGTVEEAGWTGDDGYRIIIDHGNHLKTLFAHCSELLVKQGDKVKRSQVIARAGNSGIATEPHVHYEIVKDGKQIDPEDFNNDLLKRMKK